jgi:FkbM family methyltransferase
MLYSQRLSHGSTTVGMALDLTEETQIAYLSRGNFAYAAPLVRTFERFVEPGSTVIDVGANVGYFTLLAACLGAEQIIAFEPEPLNYATLQLNVSRNALWDKVHCERVALSSSSGSGVLTLNPINLGGHTLNDTSDNYFEQAYGGSRHSNLTTSKISVDKLSFDDYVAAAGHIKRIDFMKIDVEGHELEVLRGMVSTLRKFRPRALLLEDYGNWQGFAKILDGAGYEPRFFKGAELTSQVGERTSEADVVFVVK